MAVEKCEHDRPLLFTTFGAIRDPSWARSPDAHEYSTDHLVITLELARPCNAGNGIAPATFHRVLAFEIDEPTFSWINSCTLDIHSRFSVLVPDECRASRSFRSCRATAARFLGKANATALRTHCARAGEEPSVDTETTTSPSRCTAVKKIRAPGVVHHVEQDIAFVGLFDDEIIDRFVAGGRHHQKGAVEVAVLVGATYH